MTATPTAPINPQNENMPRSSPATVGVVGMTKLTRQQWCCRISVVYFPHTDNLVQFVSVTLPWLTAMSYFSCSPYCLTPVSPTSLIGKKYSTHFSVEPDNQTKTKPTIFCISCYCWDHYHYFLY